MSDATYPSSRADLRRRVRRRLLTNEDGTSEDHWSDSSVHDALNWAQRRVYNELLLQFETMYFTKIADNLEVEVTDGNSSRITLPSDFKRLVTFEKSASSSSSGDFVPLKVVSPARQYESRGPRFPHPYGPTHEVWSEFPGYLRSMNSLQAGGRYRVVYFHRISDLQSDEQISEVPEDYTELLVDLSAFRLAQDAGQDDRARSLKFDVNEGFGEMRRTSGQLNLNKQHRIRRSNRSRRGRRW